MLADNGRALAAQLQRYRRQVFGGGAHHMAANIGRAGKQQMVERQLREGRSDIGFTVDDRHLVLAEILGEHGLHQLAGGRGELAHLDHRAVTGSQRRQQRTNRQVHRVIPRRDDADHTKRLVHHPRLRRPLRRTDGTTLRFHPLAQLAAVVLHALEAGDDFHDLGFIERAIAEILVHRLADLVNMLEQHLLDARDLVEALLGGGIGVAGKGLALGTEQLLHAVDFAVLALQRFHFGNHDALPGMTMAPASRQETG